MITISDEDQFLLLGCDGLFDVYTPEDIITFIKTNMEKHGDTQKCCQVCRYNIYIYIYAIVYICYIYAIGIYP